MSLGVVGREHVWGSAHLYTCGIAFVIKEQRWEIDQVTLLGWGLHRKWYFAVSEGLEWDWLPELNIWYNPSSVAVPFQSSGPGHMSKPLVCVRGHGCWCRPSWSGGNSPPSAPHEGSQAWSQLGMRPSRADRAFFPGLLWGSANCASQTWNLSYVVIFEEILTSGFYLFILYIYFALVCISWVYMHSQNWTYLPLRVPFKNRVTKTQPCIKWGPLGRTTLNFIRNLLLGIMLLGLNKKLPLKWGWRKECHSGRIAAHVFPSHFNKTRLSSGLLRTRSRRRERVLMPLETVNADIW